MFLAELGINTKEVIEGGYTSKYKLKDLLKDYAEQCNIASVVGQSESFICDHCDEGFTDMSKEVSIDIKCYEKLLANK